MSCGVSCARILLIIFNFIFWLSGAALLAVGIWMVVDHGVSKYLKVLSVLESSGEIFNYAAYVLIAVGAFVLIVGFFGCCGALRKNRCMLTMYIIFLVIVMLAEIAAGVLGIVFREQIKSGLEKKWKDQAKKYYHNDTDSLAFRGGMDLIQIELKCCGWTGKSDYLKALPCGNARNCTITGQPYSCCPDNKNCLITSMYSDGCSEGIEGWLERRIPILIGIGIGIACLELFGLIFAVCLCRNVEED